MVFGLKKATLDRIPRYRRTLLKEEFLYLLDRDAFDHAVRNCRWMILETFRLLYHYDFSHALVTY